MRRSDVYVVTEVDPDKGTITMERVKRRRRK